ncbi:MAG: peptidoglycan-binding domain-containing protein [Lachnospiraceae bacterium]
MHSVRRHRRFCASLLTCVLLTASLPGLAASTTLKLGSRGTAVLQLQQALIALGYDTKGADGKFGKGTEQAVKAISAGQRPHRRRQGRREDAGAALCR